MFQTFLSGTWGWRDYDVAPDGKFILNRLVKEDARPIVVVLGFDRTLSELAR